MAEECLQIKNINTTNRGLISTLQINCGSLEAGRYMLKEIQFYLPNFQLVGDECDYNLSSR